MAAEDAFSSAAIRAVAHHRLGDTHAAREWLARARRLFRITAGTEEEAWEHSPFFGLLAEADALID